jgi:hypothetical protein
VRTARPEPQGSVQISRLRYSLGCSLCDQCYGASVQCSAGNKCYTAFHPLCARLAGLPMQEINTENHQALQELKRNVRKIAGCNASRFSLKREGTALASGIHLVAFCPKHQACAVNIAAPVTYKPSFSTEGEFPVKALPSVQTAGLRAFVWPGHCLRKGETRALMAVGCGVQASVPKW